MSDTHTGLPVAGYVDQSAGNVALVNENKQLEERLLRQIERLHELGTCDPRMLHLATTGIQQACMWLNRAVFQPGRVTLPEDPLPEPEPVPAPVAATTSRKAAAVKAAATRAAKAGPAGGKRAKRG